VRRIFTVLTLLTCGLLLSACGGGNSNTSVNANRIDTDSTVNSERIESSNIAPTGGPGPEPESRGAQSSSSAGNANANANSGENKNKADNRNK
jgi:hypothetical protein